MTTPKTCHLTFRAAEDLAALIDESITTAPQLEWGGVIIGFYDERRGRVVVEQLRKNFAPPTSSWQVRQDPEAMMAFDREGRRVVGGWHTHPSSEPIEPSDADRDTLKRSAAHLDQPVYLGLIFAPISTWWEGVPRSSWEEPPAPQIFAHCATPSGRLYGLTVARQPEWMARLESQVIFRTEARHG